MTPDFLLTAALAAREHAFAPFSKFKVGAAVEDESGHIHSGCNVESATYGLTVCAERVALFAARCAGAEEIEAIAVIADLSHPIAPCGACRQVIAELAPRARIVMANLRGEIEIGDVDTLLPGRFEFESPAD